MLGSVRNGVHIDQPVSIRDSIDWKLQLKQRMPEQNEHWMGDAVQIIIASVQFFEKEMLNRLDICF